MYDGRSAGSFTISASIRNEAFQVFELIPVFISRWVSIMNRPGSGGVSETFSILTNRRYALIPAAHVGLRGVSV